MDRGGFILLAALLLLAPRAPATAQEVFVLPRLNGPIVIDGRIDEAAWQALVPLPLTMLSPVFEGPLTERSEIRIGYDDEYLYAAGRFYDSDPAGIHANALTRDRGSDSDDYFGVILDTFDDNENALAFMTTPAGIRVDQAVFNDAEIASGTMPLNESWNTFWDVATVVNDEGWFAEMRIPFSSLRFQDTDGRVTMGLITWRWISRKSEAQTFPSIPPRWMLAHIKPSIAQNVVLDGVYSRKPLYLTPYVLGGIGKTAERNEAETAYRHNSDFTRDLGLDLKYGFTSNLTLDLTVNTDFAQVEADDQQVNLTRFSLFFPEKRQFFQERASIFDFNTGGQTRLFYSRRIGLSDDGPVRLYGGLRAVGRIGPWDVGLLNMQTAQSDALPSENFGVVRLRRQIFNENSYAGAIATSRLGDDGTYNLAYGFDGVLRLFGDDYLLVNWAQTVEDTLVDAGALDAFNTGLLRARWQRRTNEGLAYDAGFTWVGPDYNPGTGFVFRTGFTRMGDQLSYTWLAPDTSRFLNHALGLNGSVFLRNEDGSVESAEGGPTYTTQFRSSAFGLLNPTVFYENLREPFELSDDVSVPAGSYTFFGVTGFYMMGPRLLRTGVILNAGTFYDGRRFSLSLSPAWNVSRFLELGGEVQFNRVRFPSRDARFDAHVARLRVRAAFNTHLSLSTFVQYSTASDDVTINARVRYNVREGHDLYIVYNEGLNTNRLDRTPVLPLTDNRTLLLKYTYTFILGG